jgi:hypothetical protein
MEPFTPLDHEGSARDALRFILKETFVCFHYKSDAHTIVENIHAFSYNATYYLPTNLLLIIGNFVV